MMKKIGIIKVLGVLFITFGITFLNLDDLSFSGNFKAYLSLIIGLVIVFAAFLRIEKSEQ